MTHRPSVWLFALLVAPASVCAEGLSLLTTTGGDVGVQVFGHTYDADRNGAFDLSTASKKIGITGSFSQSLGDGWYWGADGRYAWGATSFSSAARGSNSGNAESLLEVRVTAGRDFDAGSQVLSPYTGLGYRAIYSNLKAYTDTGYVSPTRNGNLVYLPVGLTHRLRLASDSRLATTLEGDYLLAGTQQTRYTDIVGYTSDLSVSQRRGYGARLNIAYETTAWSAGVFYHYWNIEESETGTYANTSTVFTATEAHNITREIGVHVKFRFN